MRAAVRATQLWLERVVIGLTLCPWAKPAHDRAAVHFVHVAAADAEVVFASILAEMENIRAGNSETTLLVVPNAFEDDFADFNEFLQNVEEYLQDEAMDDEFQLVGFHPCFQFADEDSVDPSNWVNRSPWPTIHILRQDDVTKAVTDNPKLAEEVPSNNQRVLRAMGVDTIRDLVSTAVQDSGGVAGDRESTVAASSALCGCDG